MSSSLNTGKSTQDEGPIRQYEFDSDKTSHITLDDFEEEHSVFTREGWTEARKDALVVILRAMSAEFLGAFFIAFIEFGTSIGKNQVEGDARLHQLTNSVVEAAISVAFNFILTAQSGSIFNPAVTFTLMLVRKLTPLRGALYIVSQLLGSIFGAFMIRVIIPADWEVDLTTLLKELDQISPGQGVLLEALLTMVICLVVLFLSVSKVAIEHHKIIHPFVAGCAILAASLVGTPLVGAGPNPARAFGPAVVSNVWADHWVFWVGPMIGSFLAVGFFLIHHTQDYFGTKR